MTPVSREELRIGARLFPGMFAVSFGLYFFVLAALRGAGIPVAPPGPPGRIPAEAWPWGVLLFPLGVLLLSSALRRFPAAVPPTPASRARFRRSPGSPRG